MTNSRLAVACCFMVLSSISGCSCLFPDLFGGTGGGTGGGSGGGGDFTINGRMLNGQGAGPDGRVEVKKNGVVLGTTTATSGFFSIDVDPGGPSTLLVSFKADGFAPVLKTVKADVRGEVELEEQVVALLPLACTGTSCATGGLRVDGLPDGTTGSARAFNPVTESNAFPGGFDDSDGNLLLSGAFATVELKDSTGQPLTQMASPATLRMPFPQDTWPLVVDLVAGDAKVTVPLYYFDEALATWKREGEGDLVTDSGALVPEGEIPNVRAKTYAGALFVTGQVRHFSTWNVDWPIESHGCVSGRILADTRAPKEGAKVEIEGVTYNGRSPTMVTGADGRFCADVLRSEGPGEDVDRNGVTGQAQRVTIYVSDGDRIYDGKEHQIPTQPASCSVGCLEVGDIVLDATSEFPTTLCAVSGVLVDQLGTPIAGMGVTGFSTASSEQIMALCPDYSCASLSRTTDASGAFSGTLAVRDRLTLLASRTDMPEPRTTRHQQAYAISRGCPRTPVRLVMGPATLYTEIDVTVTGNLISWVPAVAMSSVAVVSAGGDAKWAVFASTPVITPPVTYGTTPAGTFSLPGAGGGLTSGDDVVVQGMTQQGGEQRVYNGTTTVP